MYLSLPIFREIIWRKESDTGYRVTEKQEEENTKTDRDKLEPMRELIEKIVSRNFWFLNSLS